MSSNLLIKDNAGRTLLVKHWATKTSLTNIWTTKLTLLVTFILLLCVRDGNGASPHDCPSKPGHVWVDAESPITGWFQRTSDHVYGRTVHSVLFELRKTVMRQGQEDLTLSVRHGDRVVALHFDHGAISVSCPSICTCRKISIHGLTGYEYNGVYSMDDNTSVHNDSAEHLHTDNTSTTHDNPQRVERYNTATLHVDITGGIRHTGDFNLHGGDYEIGAAGQTKRKHSSHETNAGSQRNSHVGAVQGVLDQDLRSNIGSLYNRATRANADENLEENYMMSWTLQAANSFQLQNQFREAELQYQQQNQFYQDHLQDNYDPQYQYAQQNQQEIQGNYKLQEYQQQNQQYQQPAMQYSHYDLPFQYNQHNQQPQQRQNQLYQLNIEDYQENIQQPIQPWMQHSHYHPVQPPLQNRAQDHKITTKPQYSSRTKQLKHQQRDLEITNADKQQVGSLQNDHLPHEMLFNGNTEESTQKRAYLTAKYPRDNRQQKYLALFNSKYHQTDPGNFNFETSGRDDLIKQRSKRSPNESNQGESYKNDNTNGFSSSMHKLKTNNFEQDEHIKEDILRVSSVLHLYKYQSPPEHNSVNKNMDLKGRDPFTITAFQFPHLQPSDNEYKAWNTHSYSPIEQQGNNYEQLQQLLEQTLKALQESTTGPVKLVKDEALQAWIIRRGDQLIAISDESASCPNHLPTEGAWWQVVNALVPETTTDHKLDIQEMNKPTDEQFYTDLFSTDSSTDAGESLSNHDYTGTNNNKGASEQYKLLNKVDYGGFGIDNQWDYAFHQPHENTNTNTNKFGGQNPHLVKRNLKIICLN